MQAALLCATAFIALIALGKYVPALASLPESSLTLATVIISLTVFVNQLNIHFLNLAQANQRFDIFNYKTLLVGSANTVFAALLSFVSPRIDSLFLLQLVFHLLTAIFVIRYCYSFFPSHSFWPRLHRGIFYDLLGFGLKNFVGTLAGQIEVQFSKFALGSLVSAAAVTAYSIPQSIVVKGAGIVSQVAQAVFPLSASLLAKDRIIKLRQLLFLLQGLVFLGGVTAIVISLLYGRQFLSWWLKDPVVVGEAFPILSILSFYFLLTSLTPIPTVVIQSLGKPQIPSLFAVATAVIEIIAALLLIPSYGVSGVAYGALISSAITVPTFLLVFYVLFQKEIKRTQSPPYTPPPLHLA